MNIIENSKTITLAALATQAGIDPSHIKRFVRLRRAAHPDVPFPEPVQSYQKFDLYETQALIEWASAVGLVERLWFNWMAKRFIRGEFDRAELQRKYQMKRIRAKLRMRAA